MANRTYAGEWLLFARKNLEAAEILLNADHYSDIIGAELQQGVEKTLKAMLAYHDRSIPKTHDLNLLASLLAKELEFSEEDLDRLDRITMYYKFERYPNPVYFLPSKLEIEAAMEFGRELYKRVCIYTDITKENPK